MEEMKKKQFADFLEEKNDEIDNLAYQLLCALVSAGTGTEQDPEDVLEWDMEYIGEVVLSAENTISNMGMIPCHPFFEGCDSIPCFLGDDCKRIDCPFRQSAGE